MLLHTGQAKALLLPLKDIKSSGCPFVFPSKLPTCCSGDTYDTPDLRGKMGCNVVLGTGLAILKNSLQRQ